MIDQTVIIQKKNTQMIDQTDDIPRAASRAHLFFLNQRSLIKLLLLHHHHHPPRIRGMCMYKKIRIKTQVMCVYVYIDLYAYV